MLDYQGTDQCRMSFLRLQLDDPSLGVDERCGRCDNCTGARFGGDVDAAEAEQTRVRLMRPGVELAPRKQWPSGLAKLGVDLSGRITDGAAPGRVIGRLTDLGWGSRLRALLTGPDASDAEVPADVVRCRDKGTRGMGLGSAADSGARAGLRTASAADLVTDPKIGRTRQADRSGHAAIRARSGGRSRQPTRRIELRR